MEEKVKKLFMLHSQLDQNFNEEQWMEISQFSGPIFLKYQQSILNNLLRNKPMFEKYFSQFYSNHVKLFHWSMLAIEKKFQIEQYIFKRLVNNGITFYNQKLKEAFGNKFVRNSIAESAMDKCQLQNLEEEVYNQFFKDILQKNKQKTGPLNLKLYGPQHQQEQQNFDSHDFYIKTFDACNGWKYIFYNYEKHMKGLSEKHKYNKSIRVKHSKHLFERKDGGKLNLCQFEHSHKSKENGRCSVVKMNEFLKNKRLNSMKGFRTLANDKKTQKVVFVNHQGKPLTYRVSRP